jgi:hypothetical protein
MDKIINVLLLIIIFVFDPLAISLVIASNFAFEKAYPKKIYNEHLYEEIVEEKSELYKTMDNIISPEVKIKYEDIPIKVAGEEEFDWEVAEKRMEIIGQNGNEGEHYSKYDLNKDKILNPEEILNIKNKIKQIKNESGGNLPSYEHRVKEIKNLEKLLKLKGLDDDLTKTY